MNAAVYSALTYPHISSALDVLNPLKNNMFKGYITSEHNSYFKL